MWSPLLLGLEKTKTKPQVTLSRTRGHFQQQRALRGRQFGWDWCPGAPTTFTTSDHRPWSKLVNQKYSCDNKTLHWPNVFHAETQLREAFNVLKDQMCRPVPSRNSCESTVFYPDHRRHSLTTDAVPISTSRELHVSQALHGIPWGHRTLSKAHPFRRRNSTFFLV